MDPNYVIPDEGRTILQFLKFVITYLDESITLVGDLTTDVIIFVSTRFSSFYFYCCYLYISVMFVVF